MATRRSRPLHSEWLERPLCAQPFSWTAPSDALRRLAAGTPSDAAGPQPRLTSPLGSTLCLPPEPLGPFALATGSHSGLPHPCRSWTSCGPSGDPRSGSPPERSAGTSAQLVVCWASTAGCKPARRSEGPTGVSAEALAAPEVFASHPEPRACSAPQARAALLPSGRRPLLTTCEGGLGRGARHTPPSGTARGAGEAGPPLAGFSQSLEERAVCSAAPVPLGLDPGSPQPSPAESREASWLPPSQLLDSSACCGSNMSSPSEDASAMVAMGGRGGGASLCPHSADGAELTLLPAAR